MKRMLAIFAVLALTVAAAPLSPRPLLYDATTGIMDPWPLTPAAFIAANGLGGTTSGVTEARVQLATNLFTSIVYTSPTNYLTAVEFAAYSNSLTAFVGLSQSSSNRLDLYDSTVVTQAVAGANIAIVRSGNKITVTGQVPSGIITNGGSAYLPGGVDMGESGMLTNLPETGAAVIYGTSENGIGFSAADGMPKAVDNVGNLVEFRAGTLRSAGNVYANGLFVGNAGSLTNYPIIAALGIAVYQTSSGTIVSNSDAAHTDGNTNSFLGESAFENGAGWMNVAVGAGAMQNYAGKTSVAAGASAGLNASGTNNTFVGNGSGQGAVGNNFTGVGRYALMNGSGGHHLGVGDDTLVGAVGDFQTAIGEYAGDHATNSYSLFIDQFATQPIASNTLAIGNAMWLDGGDARAILHLGRTNAWDHIDLRGTLDITPTLSNAVQAIANAQGYGTGGGGDTNGMTGIVYKSPTNLTTGAAALAYAVGTSNELANVRAKASSALPHRLIIEGDSLSVGFPLGIHKNFARIAAHDKAQVKDYSHTGYCAVDPATNNILYTITDLSAQDDVVIWFGANDMKGIANDGRGTNVYAIAYGADIGWLSVPEGMKGVFQGGAWSTAVGPQTLGLIWGGNVALLMTNSTDGISGTVYGSTILIDMSVQFVKNASWQLYVDGVSQGTNNIKQSTNFVCNGTAVASRYSEQNFGPSTYIYSGFGDGWHTVSVQALANCNSTNQIIANWMGAVATGGLGRAALPRVFVVNQNRQSAARYASSGGSDTLATNMCIAVSNVVAQFWNAGLNVYGIDAHNTLTNLATQFQSDGCHLSYTGQVDMANALSNSPGWRLN